MSELVERAPRVRGTSRIVLLVAGLALVVVVLGASVTALAIGGPQPEPTPAPITGLLALASDDTIFIADPAAGTTRAITAKTLHDAYPVWSPDGTRLVVSQHDGRGQLELIDADGSNRHPIVKGLTSAGPAAWSPDGSRLAFAGYSYPGVGEPGLYVVNPDGTALTLLLPGRDMSHAAGLAWSPDGSMIAFAAIDPAKPIDGARGFVFVVDVASGKVSQVSSSHVATTGDAPLGWRPGRMELLYAQQYKQFGELGHEDVILAELVGDTWQERQVVASLRRSDVTNPMWLDGDRVAYVRDNRLWVHALDGSPEFPITEAGLNPTAPGCVAPNGSAVAVPVSQSGGDIGPDALLVVPTNGDPPIRAISGSIDAYGAACSWFAPRP